MSFEFDREGNSPGRRTIVFHHVSNDWKMPLYMRQSLAKENKEFLVIFSVETKFEEVA